jgi:hypothetical protein
VGASSGGPGGNSTGPADDSDRLEDTDGADGIKCRAPCGCYASLWTSRTDTGEVLATPRLTLTCSRAEMPL